MDRDVDTVIDLTSSFTLANHLPNEEIICVDSDESFEFTSKVAHNMKFNANNIQITSEKMTRSSKEDESTGNILGDCPICWDKLGNNQLASTKCGHVYCLKCLEQSLRFERKCPTCRCTLKGKSAYHVLFLSIE